jgi:hypothetical protein
VTASVLAPRLMVKWPAIGQRSICAARTADSVILIPCNSNDLLAQRNQVWLVSDLFYNFFNVLLQFPLKALSGKIRKTIRELAS